MRGHRARFMKHPPCNESVRRHFRVISNALLGLLIFAIVGVIISVLIIVNIMMRFHFFSFSDLIDPPYLGIICIITLALTVVILIQLNKLKHKTCDAVEGPFL